MLFARNTGKMVDERQRVIRDLLLRLEAVGISPERPFDASFVPGLGWTFEQVDGSASSPSSSAETGVARAPKIHKR